MTTTDPKEPQLDEPQPEPEARAAGRSVRELLDDLATLPAEDADPALQQLGRLPLEKGKFPVMGYLATVYDTLGGVLPDDD